MWHAPPAGILRTIARTLAPVPPPKRVELVWLPAYLVTIPLDLNGRLNDAVCSIDGLSGSFAIFQAGSALDDGAVPGESFPPAIGAADAERIARELLITTILRRRGRFGKPTPGPTRSIQPLLWPYWVFYHSRRGGRIDIQLLDAVTGVRPGRKIKLGLLEAFRAAARASSVETEGTRP